MMTFLHANNIKINQAHKITLYVLALSSQTGETSFSAPSNAFDLQGAEYCYPINYNIATMSIDDFCQAHHFDPTHIKIDVDGGELDLLSGTERTLASQRTKTLLIEVNDNTREPALRKLNQMGFLLQKEVRHGDTSNCIFKRT
jgi:FkbM family methyltransferase